MKNPLTCGIASIVFFFLLILVGHRNEGQSGPSAPPLLAGAAVVDVSPQTWPVLVNGGMTSRTASSVTTPLKARAVALGDGAEKAVIVVVDSCMMPRPLLDSAKKRAFEKTGLPANRILISATHTHSAGSCMGALGTPADPDYSRFLEDKLVETIELALKRLQPAEVGFGRIDAAELTAVRRWIRRPDRVEMDPFGNPTVRANMHAGANWDNVTGESGPEDPELCLISIRTKDKKPIAVLANFSMHYFAGEKEISADYFGLFCEGLKQKLAPGSEFVGIMSHGCSGDIWRRDYTRPDLWNDKLKIEEYASSMIGKALAAMQGMSYQDHATLAMEERRLTLRYRTPTKQMLEWSQRIVAAMGDRLPKTTEEVYAQEQIILNERQQTEVVTQALRIGDIAIATTPCETYALTGMKIKGASPLEKTMVIELANGGDGYIPPPEQHLFGGYNTWAARSAGLEVNAEPKIKESCISLLEKVAGAQRRYHFSPRGPLAQAIADLKPQAWYRLNESEGPRAIDSSGNRNDGIYEPHITYFLEGPDSEAFAGRGAKNRAAMFVGDRLRTHPVLGSQWTASLWIWNGMPNEGREVSGWFLSTGNDHGLSERSLHLGVGGKNGHPGNLILQTGAESSSITAGKATVPRWQWQHVALVRNGGDLRVYLGGDEEMKISGANIDSFPGFFFGGRSDNLHNWEGRLDEIALFNRVLSGAEIKKLAGN